MKRISLVAMALTIIMVLGVPPGTAEDPLEDVWDTLDELRYCSWFDGVVMYRDEAPAAVRHVQDSYYVYFGDFDKRMGGMNDRGMQRGADGFDYRVFAFSGSVGFDDATDFCLTSDVVVAGHHVGPGQMPSDP